MPRPRKIGNIRKACLPSADRISLPEDTFWRSVDVKDGTWTFGDVTGNVNEGSTSTSTSGMSFSILGADGDASNQGQWGAANNSCDRYSRKLIGPNGQLKWTDQFTFECIIELGTTNEGRREGVMFGLAESPVVNSANTSGTAPVSSTTTEFEFYGAKLHHRQTGSGAGDGVYGAIQSGQGQSTFQHSDGVKLYCSWGPPQDTTDADGDPIVRRGIVYLMDTNDRQLTGTGVSDFTHEFENGDGDVYMFLAPGMYSTSTGWAADPVYVVKVWYRINMLHQGMAPSYIPNGGYSTFGGMDLK